MGRGGVIISGLKLGVEIMKGNSSKSRTKQVLAGSGKKDIVSFLDVDGTKGQVVST